MIHVFIGTKAQLIKMAPIMRLMQDKSIPYNFIFSGQHKETISDLRDNFGLKAPDHTLYSGKDITSVPQMLIWAIRISILAIVKRRMIWGQDKENIVLNHGDTFSTLLGSLLAKLLGFKNAHIESGLRSFNIFRPFPEELVRLIVFRLSDYYFSPGEWAQKNLNKYKGSKINTHLNTLYDSLQTIRTLTKPTELKLPECSFAVVSIHRYETISQDTKLKSLVKHLVEISKSIDLIFILHKPTEQRLRHLNLLTILEKHPKIHLHPRYDYLTFISITNDSKFVITDGGSNQEECYYMGKPCLLFRSETERKEGIGENCVISQFNSQIINQFIDNYASYVTPEKQLIGIRPSEIIIQHITKYSALRITPSDA